MSTKVTEKVADSLYTVGASTYHSMTEADTSEVPELMGILKMAPGRILEIGAGAGRLTLPMLRAGREVTAVDLSAELLEILNHRVSEEPELSQRLRVFKGDAAQSLPEGPFGLGVIGTVTLGVFSPEDRAQLWQNMRAVSSSNTVWAFSAFREEPTDIEVGGLTEHRDGNVRRVTVQDNGREYSAASHVVTTTSVVTEAREHGFDSIRTVRVRGPKGRPEVNWVLVKEAEGQ